MDRALRNQRLRVVLLLAVVFGLPTVVMLSYLGTRRSLVGPPYAEQPGGRVTGSVVFEDGTPAAGEPVRVHVRRRGRPPKLHATVEVGADGGFAAEVPPVDGCYVVVAGGGTWVETAREVSLVGKAPPPELVLRPGCEVALAIVRRDGREVERGSYELTRAPSGFGFPVPSVAITGTFEGPVLRRGGLRPGRWTLALELADGTEATFELELEPGLTELELAPI